MSRERVVKLTLALLGVSFVIWVVVLAAVREIFYDEAYTYMNYAINLRLSDVPRLFHESLANNHWLNTVLINWTGTVLNEYWNVFVIRLPNVIASAGFVGAVLWGVRKELIHPFTACLLLTCPLFPLWFSQARGNGLALALTMLGMVWYLQWRADERDLWLNLSLGAFALATFAITTTVFSFACIVACMLTRLWKEHALGRVLKRWWFYHAAVVVSQLLMVVYSINTTAPGMPRPENTRGLFGAVFAGAIAAFTASQALQRLLGGALVIVLVAAGALLAREHKLRDSACLLPFCLLLALLAGLKHVADIDYPIDRLLMEYLPLMFLALQESACAITTAFWKACSSEVGTDRKDSFGPRALKIAAGFAAVVLVLAFNFQLFQTARSAGHSKEELILKAADAGIPAVAPDTDPAYQFYASRLEYLAGISVEVQYGQP